MNYLQIIVQAATKVHVTQGHVRHLDTEEATQLSTDIYSSLFGLGLLFYWDCHPPPVVGKEFFLQ